MTENKQTEGFFASRGVQGTEEEVRQKGGGGQRDRDVKAMYTVINRTRTHDIRMIAGFDGKTEV